ncbi:MAG: pilin [Patescibacteria group bacterium]
MYRIATLAKYKSTVIVAIAIAMSVVIYLAGAPTAYGACTTNAECVASVGAGSTCVGGACTVVAGATVGSTCDPVTDPFCIKPIQDTTKLGKQGLQTTVASIINVALSLLGIVAVVIILVGGFKWMLAGGNDEKTQEARKLIFAGIIGLAIVLSAFAIAKFVLKALSDATMSGTVPL